MSDSRGQTEHKNGADTEQVTESERVQHGKDVTTGSSGHSVAGDLNKTVGETVTTDEMSEDNTGVQPTHANSSRLHPDFSATPQNEASHSQAASQQRTEIENEASAHLARRASEMTLDTNEPAEMQHIDPTPYQDQNLPDSPPPPPLPEKDRVKEKRQTRQAEEQGLDEKQPLDEIDNQDVPEGPRGVPEQTGTEIASIMTQFQVGQAAPGEDEIMSLRLERQQSVLQLPPRTSSLEAKDKFTVPPFSTSEHQSRGDSAIASDRTSITSVRAQPANAADETSSITSHRTSIFQPPPPSPDPEPALPFDFHRFLEQLRHRTADPVARFLRSFLQEFGKKQWMVHEQVKIIGDFLEFISKKMAQCEVWRTVSDVEFDNAREGMEKLVMNRLYTQTFSPAIHPANSPRKAKSSSKANTDAAIPQGPGRRGQHQEDVERDDVIAQKMRIYGWIKEEHLDIKPIGDKGRKFLTMAQQELLKINTYRAPRDKVICVLNCCKVIFGFLKNSKADQSADAFVPLLIYTVLQARPEHLVSNVQYIWRFRNQDKLGSEAGYYMSSLMGVVSFVENLDRTMITISDEEFEKHVEQAVSAIAEGHKAGEYEDKAHHGPSAPQTPKVGMQHLSEKSALARPEVTPRNSMEAEQSSPRKRATQRSKERRANERDDDDGSNDAVSGLLRTIQKPLSSIGRIFSDDGAAQQSSNTNTTRQSRGLNPGFTTDRRPSQDRRSPSQRRSTEQDQERQRINADVAAAQQASVNMAQAQQERARGLGVVVETLQGMFPNLDREVIEDVVRSQEGNVGRAVDTCLALSDQQ